MDKHYGGLIDYVPPGKLNPNFKQGDWSKGIERI
jgi:hypothetical protein